MRLGSVQTKELFAKINFCIIAVKRAQGFTAVHEDSQKGSTVTGAKGSTKVV